MPTYRVTEYRWVCQEMTDPIVEASSPREALRIAHDRAVKGEPRLDQIYYDEMLESEWYVDGNGEELSISFRYPTYDPPTFCIHPKGFMGFYRKVLA